MVDVTGINRDVLLKALWEKSKPASLFKNMPSMAPPFNLDEAKSKMLGEGYIDYACGRLIKSKVYAESNTIDPRLYDRDNGSGSFQSVVDSLK